MTAAPTGGAAGALGPAARAGWAPPPVTQPAVALPGPAGEGHPGPFGWQDRAACRGLPVTLFFAPERGESGPEKTVRERAAKAACNRCPVRLECLNYALARPEKYGRWGGMTEVQREAERRRRRRSPATWARTTQPRTGT